ncbi:MAG: O-acetyl-ADP-ribose deacetylase [Spirochaetales bacterium]|nr:O-acetyl-ADP-ribose deacetylase [Spirochaetales bacterium]
MVLKSFFSERLIIETGDITQKKVDAIVNAANSSLLGGGGVDGAIHRAGGRIILSECKKIRENAYPDGLPTGKAIHTSAGNLPAKYIIHTVGPVWYGGKRGEPGLLRSAYENSLKIAGELGAKSIAFPAISTGVFGYPKEEAAGIVYNIIETFIKKYKIPEKIFLVFFNKLDADIFIENTGNPA